MTIALSADDLLAIRELNSRHFYALDGLNALIPGDPGENWAKTFTADGTFSIVRTNGEVVVEVQGTEALVQLFSSFPDVEITRHWTNGLLVESEADWINGGCYIIAMNIGNNPATIIRSGVYQDQLVKVANEWKFKSRKLILDASSPAA